MSISRLWTNSDRFSKTLWWAIRWLLCVVFGLGNDCDVVALALLVIFFGTPSTAELECFFFSYSLSGFFIFLRLFLLTFVLLRISLLSKFSCWSLPAVGKDTWSAFGGMPRLRPGTGALGFRSLPRCFFLGFPRGLFWLVWTAITSGFRTLIWVSLLFSGPLLFSSTLVVSLLLWLPTDHPWYPRNMCMFWSVWTIINSEVRFSHRQTE